MEPKTQLKKEIGERFLISFFREVISNVKIPEDYFYTLEKNKEITDSIENELIQSAQQSFFEKNLQPNPPIPQITRKIISLPPYSQSQMQAPQRLRTLSGPLVNQPKNFGVKELEGRPPIRITPVPEKSPTLNLEKINKFLLDPSIRMIECPGADKPVLVTRAGIIQTTNVILSTEEVNRYLNEISQKTRVPLMPGIFKAAIGDLLVDAVLSELAGTRFIIQRMQNPNILPFPNMPPRR